jgi:peptide/nickel transport system substrate-binding protein/microcin C transport system substrate-binding protein
MLEWRRAAEALVPECCASSLGGSVAGAVCRVLPADKKAACGVKADSPLDIGRRRFHGRVLSGALAAHLPVFAADDERPVTGQWVHAYAAFGRPALGPDFTHFPYVNPDAPKRGTLSLSNPDRRSSFNKYNYFTLMGEAPAGLMHFMLETLAWRGSDERMTMYGLLAESMLVAPDKSSITFRLNPKARFYNGDPVLAEDVKFSFDMVAGPKADPGWQSILAVASAAVVLGERTVRFDMKERSNDALFTIGTVMQVFSRKWAPGKAFDEIVSEIPITSGPYTIDRVEGARRLEFKRRNDYWALDLPVRRGFFNFDRVVYRYYQDEDITTEAFKAGEFDILRAYSARIFARQHRGPKWDDGRIVKGVWNTETVEALQSYQLNLRRSVFQDIRVREAIALAFDFEQSNRYKTFKYADSLFNNSEFAADGLPSPGELALLEPFRAELPKEVFGPPYRVPRTTDDPLALRRNLLKARSLLEAAGWKLAPDGRLRNAKGEALEFEYLGPGETVVREIEWARNLEKLGIKLAIRKVDYALFSRRLQEYDFDTTTIVEGHYTLPNVSDYVRLYGSKSADEKGNGNYRGVKSKAVDHVLDAMGRAETMQQLRDACRALDRIVMWSHWQVPQLFAANITLSYWNKFDMPAKLPRFFTVSVTQDVEPQLAWPELTWWPKA